MSRASKDIRGLAKAIIIFNNKTRIIIQIPFLYDHSLNSSMGTEDNLEYPPKNVELAYFSLYDPKTDLQSTAIMMWGPKDNQLRLLVTSLAGGKVAKHFTLDIKAQASGIRSILLAARDPTTQLYKIQREGKVRIDFKIDGREYLLSMLQNPRNTDLTLFHVTRRGESPKHAIRGNFVRVHHSGWYAAVAMVAIVSAVVAYAVHEGADASAVFEVTKGDDSISITISTGGNNDQIEEDPPE